ncbi:MAG: HD domain-containing protein [Solirubrobacteraceae bacterium]
MATVLLVRSVEARRARDGGEYLALTLGDRTGSVTAVVLDRLDEARVALAPGGVVHVAGTFRVDDRLGARLLVDAVRLPDEREYAREDLIDGPARSVDQMEADLRGLVATVQDADLQRLLALVFGGGSAIWEAFRDAPAAKHYHQAYRHGLLEHCLTVAQAVSAISATFPGIDRDVAVTGALLHDLGKLDTYELRGDTIEMTDQGRLYGEISLGYYRVRAAIDALDDFPADTAQAVLHIILSHHGSLEHGSPVIPCTREATLVHMIDNLGGRLGSFDRVEKGLPAGAQWSGYDKGIGGGAYFASPPVAQRQAA